MSDSLKNLFESMYVVCILVMLVGFLVDTLVSFNFFLSIQKRDENIFRKKREKYINIRPYISSTIALAIVGINIACIFLTFKWFVILIWILNCYFWIKRAIDDYNKAMKK